jgi:hypothetical protein
LEYVKAENDLLNTLSQKFQKIEQQLTTENKGKVKTQHRNPLNFRRSAHWVNGPKFILNTSLVFQSQPIELDKLWMKVGDEWKHPTSSKILADKRWFKSQQDDVTVYRVAQNSIEGESVVNEPVRQGSITNGEIESTAYILPTAIKEQNIFQIVVNGQPINKRNLIIPVHLELLQPGDNSIEGKYTAVASKDLK